jgi:LysR family transcriptional regulator, glycine cleavage system transcriptional activator
MAKRLPSLNSLRVLAACTRHGNFSRAALELGITPTAVSQRIRALEAEMGVKLFSRHGPTLTTTDRAKALGQRVEQALSLMRTAVDDCRRVKKPLRVTCAPTFASRWLVPRLATYHTMPGADAIVLDNIQTVLPAGSFDVAIRSGVGPWPNGKSALLMMEWRTPMFSAKWATQRLTARKLLERPLIPDPGWIDWFELAGVSNAKPTFVATRYSNYDLEAQAAAQGVGAALLSPLLFADLVAQGVLVAPFALALEGRSGYWLLWNDDSPESHFVRWMKAQFDIGTEPPIPQPPLPVQTGGGRS